MSYTTGLNSEYTVCRYQEIAQHAFDVLQKRAATDGHRRQKLRHAPQAFNVFIAQEVYRVLLFSVFLAQIVVFRHVPYVGKQSLHGNSRLTHHIGLEHVPTQSWVILI